MTTTEKHPSSEREKSNNWARSMNTADYFLNLKGNGLYLEIEALTKIISDKPKTPSIRWNVNNYIAYIRKNGNSSIAHLCLSPRITGSLFRDGVETIDDLRIFLGAEKNTWEGIFGPKARVIARARLNLFDQQLQQSKLDPPQV